MNIIDFLEKELEKIIQGLGYDTEVKLLVSGRPELGDYQFNGVFALSKKYNKAIDIITEEIINEVNKTDYFSKVESISGFINFTINDKLLIKYVNDLIANPELNMYKEESKLIFLDYGGANIAKELHVGHLRSANIGEALKRLCEAAGHKTISDVHLGDWGRPMGLIIREIKDMMPELPYFDDSFEGEYPLECPVTLDVLNSIYPVANQKASEDETYLNEAREITTLLQNGHKGYYALWKSFYDLSSEDTKRIYNMLNAHFDLWEGESDADEYIPEMMEYLTKNNLTEISEGATVINVKEETDNREIPPVILIKSDGGVLYDTTELATLYSRVKRFKADTIIYLTDIRQELHFIQAFRAAYKTKMVPENVALEHLGFGTMNGPGGKPFKTRDGGVMSLNGLINMVKEETLKLIKDNIKEEDKEDLAEKLAIATIKYADLLPNRASDYIFDPVKFSDLNGKTGPYLLYSTVRMNSLLKKCEEAGYSLGDYKLLGTKDEREIILNLIKMKAIVEKSFKTRTLNELADYIYKLTSSFNAFYSEHEVLKEENADLRNSWITLTKVIYDTNVILLNIIGLEVPEKI